MLTVTMLLEDYVTRGQVGSGFGRIPGTILGGLGGGIALGGLGYALSSGDFTDSSTAAMTAIPAVIGSIGGLFGGNALGAKIGSKLISNPDAPADFGNKWHRWGYVNDEGMRIEPRDFLSSYNARNRQAQALKRMGYDDYAIMSAVNPSYTPQGVPTTTAQGVALTEPTTKVVNK